MSLAAHTTVDRAALGSWLAGVVTRHGADASTWDVRSQLVAAAMPAVDLEAWGVTGLSARSEPARSAPYPDKGHLLASPDQDGTSSRELADALTRSGVRWSPDQLRPWAQRQRAWLAETALRALVETATGATIRDKEGAELTCRDDGWVYRHAELADAFTFRARTCKARRRCPHCGKAYGDEQGAELHSLLCAALDRRSAPLTPSSSMAWGVVVTLPRAVSDHLGVLADDVRRISELRAELRRLVQVARSYLVHLFDLEDVRELGAAVNIHWWSSNNPTSGYHWHAHLLVPNVRKDGGELRRRGMFSPVKLERSRAHLTAELCAAWPGLVDGSRPANANVRWFPASKAGRRRLAHRCRYDARNPWADALKLASSRPELVYGEGVLPVVQRMADRIEDMSRVKLRRYVGWLVPGRRRPVGLEPVEREPEAWVAVADGYRQIVRFTDAGVVLRKLGWRESDDTDADAPGYMIGFDSQAPPRKWQCRSAEPVAA